VRQDERAASGHAVAEQERVGFEGLLVAERAACGADRVAWAEGVGQVD